MAEAYTVLTARSLVPTLSELHGVLKSLKFKLTVDEAYTPFETSGYLPCTINGEDGGINIAFDSAADVLADPSVANLPEAIDTAIRLKSGGDPREDVCVLMIAAALAQSNSTVAFGPSRSPVSAGQLVTDARRRFSELD